MKRKASTKSAISDAISEALRYSQAAVEYTILVSWSIFGRISSEITTQFSDIAEPVFKAAPKPFLDLKHKAKGAIRRKNYGKVVNIEEKVTRLEERVSLLEKYGIRPHLEPFREKKQAVGKEKLAFLRQILEENKLIRKAL